MIKQITTNPPSRPSIGPTTLLVVLNLLFVMMDINLQLNLIRSEGSASGKSQRSSDSLIIPY